MDLWQETGSALDASHGVELRQAGEMGSLQLLLPTPVTETTVDEAYAAPLGRHDGDRPWIQLCMVSSLDGSTVLDGASGGLSSPNDSAVLLRLRSLADVVLVGAGTAQGEGYGPPSTPGQRIAVVTRSGRVDVSTDLFTSGAGIVVTTETASIAGDDVDVIRAGVDEVDLPAAIERLAERFGARLIQAEGGPMLNAALSDADLIDELDLTTSPGLIGGDGPRLTRDGAQESRAFDLVQLAVDDDHFLFQRWRRRR